MSSNFQKFPNLSSLLNKFQTSCIAHSLRPLYLHHLLPTPHLKCFNSVLVRFIFQPRFGTIIYGTTLPTRVFINCFPRCKSMLFEHNKIIFFVKAIFLCAILCLMSSDLLPSSVMQLPRYLKDFVRFIWTFST